MKFFYPLILLTFWTTETFFAQTSLRNSPTCATCLPDPCPTPKDLFADRISRTSVRLNWQTVDQAQGYNIQIRRQGDLNWTNYSSNINWLSLRRTLPGIPYEWRVSSNCGEEQSLWSSTCTFIGADANSGNNCDQGGDQPTCTDGIQNGEETGVDCGGPDCPDCTPNAPTCEDEIQNGAETGIDCGGPNCPDCALDACPTPIGLFANGISRTNVRLNWQAIDQVQGYNIQIRRQGDLNWTNYSSSINSFYLRRAVPGITYEWRVRSNCIQEQSTWSYACTFVGADANSGSNCDEGGDQPTCTDGIQNGQETGIDCGGPDCPDCPTCTDGIQNGAETGIDCGGPNCPDCPTCTDGIQNGQETGIDCGGSDCQPCPTGSCEVPTNLMADQIQENSARLSWTEVEGALSYNLRLRIAESSRWSDLTSPHTSSSIRGLFFGSVYEWQVAAVCAGNQTSDWSAVCTFRAGYQNSSSCGSSGSECVPQGLQVWPNPATGAITVSVNFAGHRNLVMRIIDMTGSEVSRIPIENGANVINVPITQLRQGMYFLSISNREVRQITRIVVQ